MPAALNLFGEAGGAPMALLIALSCRSITLIAVIGAVRFRRGRGIASRIYVRVLKGLVKNPSYWLRFAVLSRYIPTSVLPEAIDQTIAQLAKLASPLALIALGANFDFRETAGKRGMIAAGFLLRLVLVRR